MNKNIPRENFLEKIPTVKDGLNWTTEPDGSVVIELLNKGFTNRIFQVLFKKPKISYIHLDEIGNFVWPLIDGEKDIIKIGEKVSEHFGDKAEPLYERLCQYFKALESNGFIELK